MHYQLGRTLNVGRDYGAIEKTGMMRIDPSSTDDIVKVATELRESGFAALYVYAKGIAEPTGIVDLIAAALPEVA